MYKTILATLAICGFAGITQAAPPSGEMVRKLTETIREHCPEAKIEITKEEFLASSETMKFTLHARSAGGVFSPRTFQEEGPNLKGFLLRVSLKNGKFLGATAVPQTIQGPYFPTFFDAPEDESESKHYEVNFSYGSGFDPVLKKLILEAVPRSKSQPIATPNRAVK